MNYYPGSIAINTETQRLRLENGDIVSQVYKQKVRRNRFGEVKICTLLTALRYINIFGGSIVFTKIKGSFNQDYLCNSGSRK